MLTFRENFFEEETICGFTVASEMKRAWAAEIDVLYHVISICKKYNLTYYADWGTLLGGVRHNGFVPWDDDIDIALKREDYKKLIAILPKELPAHYGVNSLYYSDTHNAIHSAITNHDFIITDPELLKEFYFCPYTAGIDIFPLDYIPSDPELAKIQADLYSLVYSTQSNLDEYTKDGTLSEKLSLIEEYCKVSFDASKPLRHQLFMLCERISSLYTEEESPYLTQFPYHITNGYKVNKEYYEKTVELPFENINISVPYRYEDTLTAMYGDWKTPIIFEAGHDYPFYKKQEKKLAELLLASRNCK